MKVSFTVGKLDAGLAVLLSEDLRLIEFPSILLPTGISAGSIVDINVSRNTAAEQQGMTNFKNLQSNVLELYGTREPERPVLRVKNATQTSVVLSWDTISTGSGELRSLTLYKNNSRLGTIPNPRTNTSTKLSGLAIDTVYTFHLVLQTTAGTFTSERVSVRTHKMTELSGITVCAGSMTEDERSRLESAMHRISGKAIQDNVAIDTTHFICSEGRGDAWKKATDMNIPVVKVEWLEACEHEGRVVGVRSYYLDADTSHGSSTAAPASHKKSRRRAEGEQSISPRSEMAEVTQASTEQQTSSTKTLSLGPNGATDSPPAATATEVTKADDSDRPKMAATGEGTIPNDAPAKGEDARNITTAQVEDGITSDTSAIRNTGQQESAAFPQFRPNKDPRVKNEDLTSMDRVNSGISPLNNDDDSFQEVKL